MFAESRLDHTEGSKQSVLPHSDSTGHLPSTRYNCFCPICDKIKEKETVVGFVVLQEKQFVPQSEKHTDVWLQS